MPRSAVHNKGYSDKKSRRYEESAADSARKHLGAFVIQCGGQKAAEKALGIGQGQLSRILDKKAQPQLALVITLRGKLGLTVDQILGLDPPPPPPSGTARVNDLAESMARVEQLLKNMKK